MMYRTALLLLLLAACANPAPTKPPTFKPVPETAFPKGLALASPLQTTPTGLQAMATTPSLAYKNHLDDLEAVLSGSASPAGKFRPEAFFLTPVRVDCYGPNLKYQNHPDGPDQPNPELPGGDLGLWTDSNLSINRATAPFTVTARDEACSAAQLNARLSGTSNQGKAGLILAATMASVAPSLPSAGSSVNVTAEINALALPGLSFSNASIAQSSAGVWNYGLEMLASHSGAPRKVVINLNHTPSSGTYSGVLSYRANTLSNGGNCGGGANNLTLNGSMKYAKVSNTSLRIQARSALVCGHDQNVLDAANQVDPSKTWADDFNAFSADFNPATYTGSYAYGWQAGSLDSHSRVLNLRLNNPASGESVALDGETYFGYGARVQSDADLVMGVGGFICNWAGPKSGPAIFHQYAQRQFVQYDAAKGVFVVPAGGSDIRYAPTRNCLNTSSSFKYDRNLNGTLDESAAELSLSSLELDLMQPADTNGDGTATIEEKLVSRGYLAPVAP
jgi:hypothetical protein